MAKTKRKELAALAAGKASAPVECEGKARKGWRVEAAPGLDAQGYEEASLARPEVRQQRVIVWIPPSDPKPQIQVCKSKFARKRKRFDDKGKELALPDGEDGCGYQDYAKIIFKLDNWRSAEGTEEAGSSNRAAAPAERLEKVYRRTKSGSHGLPKKGVLSLPAFHTEPSPSQPKAADYPATTLGNAWHTHAELSSRDEEVANRVAHDHNIAREPVADSLRTSNRRKSFVAPKRKAGSLRGLLAITSATQCQNHDQEEVTGRGKNGCGPALTVRAVSQKEVSSLEGAQSQGSIVPTEKTGKQKLEARKQTEAGVEAATQGVMHVMERTITKPVLNARVSSLTVTPTAAAESADDESKSQRTLRSQQRKVAAANTSTSPSKVLQTLPSNKVIQPKTSPIAAAQSRLTRSGKTASLPLEATPSTLLPSEMHPCNRPPVAGTISRTESPAAVQSSAAVNLQDRAKSGLVMLLTHPSKVPGCGSDATPSRHGVCPTVETCRVESRSAQKPETVGCSHKGDVLIPTQPRAVAQANTSTKSGGGFGMPISRFYANPLRSTACIQDRQGRSMSIKPVGKEWLTQPQSSMNRVSCPSPSFGNGVAQLSVWGGGPPSGGKCVDVVAVIRAKVEEAGGLTEWLIERGLGVFVEIFEERKIDEDALPHLTMGSLKEMGVHAVGPRRKLMWLIQHVS